VTAPRNPIPGSRRGLWPMAACAMVPALLMMACSETPNSMPLDPVAASLQAELPSTARVFTSKDQGVWGDVIAVDDSDERMAAGPVPGTTWDQVQHWLSTNTDRLRDAGFDHVLLCDSAVNLNPQGEPAAGLSEMLPTRANGLIRAVKTGQPSNSLNSTSIPCEVE
jgi:hypothetical protein